MATRPQGPPAESSGRSGRSRAVPRGYLPFPQVCGWSTRMVSRMSSPLRADESIAGQEALVAFLTMLTEDYRQRGKERETLTRSSFSKRWLRGWPTLGRPGTSDTRAGPRRPVATGRASLRHLWPPRSTRDRRIFEVVRVPGSGHMAGPSRGRPAPLISHQGRPTTTARGTAPLPLTSKSPVRFSPGSECPGYSLTGRPDGRCGRCLSSTLQGSDRERSPGRWNSVWYLNRSVMCSSGKGPNSCCQAATAATSRRHVP